MKLTALFDCRFSSGRAVGAPQTRRSTAHKVKMAEATAVDAAVAEPFMPRVSLDRTDLDRRYPSVTVPPAVGADDGNDHEDPALDEGLKQVKDLVRARAQQGRRRRLVSSKQATPGSSAVTHD